MFARGLPLRTLGALLAEAALFVGNDSGVSHLAAACGAPTLALFGPTDCRPCGLPWAPGPRGRSARAESSIGLDTATVAAAAREALRSWERAATSIRLISR